MALDPTVVGVTAGTEMLPDWIRNLFGPGDQQQAQAAPEGPIQGPTLDPAAAQAQQADAYEDEQIRAEDERRAREDEAAIARLHADTARLEADAERIRREAQAEDDPNKARLLQAQVAQIEQSIAASQAEMARKASQLSPEAQARLENELAMQRQAQQNEFTGGENAATREANMVTTLLNAAARRDESNQAGQIAVRGQEITRLKAQDDWVMGMLRQQVAEGTLSLQKATNMFNAYVERARMPTQILESVSRSIEPLLPYMTARKAGESPPGFEKGGPMEGLVNRAGGNYDPKQYAVRPKSLDLFKLAEKAGANFSESGKVPDPGEHFAGVKVPQTDPNRPSALQTGSLPPPPGPLPPIGGGFSPTAAAEQGQSTMSPFNMTPTAPGLSMSEDEQQRILSVLGGA